MKSLPCWMILITIAVYSGGLYGQEIILNDLRQRHCTKTEINVLLDYYVSYSFNATVKLTKALEDNTIVEFEIMRKNNKEYSFLFDVSIAYECSGLKLEIHHHCKKIGDGIFNIDVSLRNESGDKIRGQILHYNKTVLATDVKVLSGDNESSDLTGVLTINGQKMSSGINCTKTINVHGLFVEFECSNPDSPCVIEVKVDDRIVINKNTDRAIVENVVKSGLDMLVEIKYAACDFNGEVKKLTCIIKSEFNETAAFGDLVVSNAIIISVSVTASALIFIVVLVTFLVKRYKRQKHKSNTNNNDDKVKHNEANEPLLEVKEDESALYETTEDERKSKETFSKKLNKDIFSAVKNGHIETVQDIINTQPESINAQDKDGYTALIHASCEGCDKIAKLLIEKEADIFIKGHNGMNAMMLACENGHMEIEKMLFECINRFKGTCLLPGDFAQDNIKSFVNDTNKDGMTALMLASRKGNESIVNDLIDYNAEIDLIDCDGNTALMYASQNGFEFIAQSLIKGQAEVNKKNNNGRTCLMLAAEEGHLEIVKLLLEHNAFVDERDDEGFTALTFAIMRNQSKIKQILIQHGADVKEANKKVRLALKNGSKSLK